jgi:dUTP pyrophosphatase
MKFEKVSVKEFSRSIRSCMKPGETERIFQEKIDYFEKKLTVPMRSTGGSAGYDFICPFDVCIKPGEIAKIPTGIKVELDKDKFLGIYIRSSFGTKRNLELTNKVCIIDSDYYNNERNEGHILEFVRNNNNVPVTIKQGEAFCQGIIQTFFTVEGDEYGKGPKRVGGIGSTDGQNKKEIAESIEESTTEVKGVESTVVETTAPITEADHIKSDIQNESEDTKEDQNKSEEIAKKNTQPSNNDQSRKMKRKH